MFWLSPHYKPFFQEACWGNNLRWREPVLCALSLSKEDMSAFYRDKREISAAQGIQGASMQIPSSCLSGSSSSLIWILTLVDHIFFASRFNILWSLTALIIKSWNINFEDFRKTHYFHIKISKDILWSRMQKYVNFFNMKKVTSKNVCSYIWFASG